MKSRDAEALTHREKEVIELLSSGRTNEEIARQLGISLAGVKYHVSGIFRRLRVNNRHEAASLHLGTEGSVLTSREQEVIELLSTGLTNEEIARQLGISLDGVKYHVSRILRRLDVESRREAASFHLRTARTGRLVALAPVMFFRKLPLAWLSKAAAGGALTVTVAGIALLVWGVISTTSRADTTADCVGSQSGHGRQKCAPGVVQAGAASNGVSAMSDPCALKDGGVWCWNTSSGYDRQTGSIEWRAIPGLASGVSAISGGCALKDGAVWCASNSGDSLDPVRPAVMLPDLSSGVSVISGACALKDGSAWCWGSNTTDSAAFAAAAAGSGPGLPPLPVSGLGSGVSAISAAGIGACALKNGGVWCWGIDYEPLLGNPGDAGILAPVPVSGLPSGVTAISGSCALKDGGLWCWDGHARAVAVPGLERGVSAVNGSLGPVGPFGSGGICAIRDGGVWCGDGNAVAVAIPGLANGISAISTGGFHRCAVKDGAAWCWGFNGSGQLGDGSITSSSVAVAVDGMTRGVTAISASGNHSCAVQDGDIWCWGYMGDDATVSVPVPVRFSSTGAGDITAEPQAKLSPSRTDSDSHRTIYLLAGIAAGALAIIAGGGWVIWWRRRVD